MHIRIRLTTKFSLKLTILILDQICPKAAFPIVNEKSEHCHLNLHIRISLGIEFRLKLTVLTFWIIFDEKGYF